jgi:flagellar biosynthesis/type III secretory pathway protein FliH
MVEKPVRAKNKKDDEITKAYREAYAHGYAQGFNDGKHFKELDTGEVSYHE